MYILKKDITPGMVVWGEKTVYYDQPEKIIKNRRCMYVVTSVNDNYFFGCPLTTQSCMKNSTILSTKHYPIKQDSRIRETLYKVYYDQIVSSQSFKVSERTFEHFKRNLYKRIILGESDSPRMYNEPFVEEYIRTHQPEIDNILVYTSPERKFKYYYLYDENITDYIGVRLNLEKENGKFNYTVSDKELVTIPKSERFFDCYTSHTLSRDEVEEGLKKEPEKQKTLGSKIREFFKLK